MDVRGQLWQVLILAATAGPEQAELDGLDVEMAEAREDIRKANKGRAAFQRPQLIPPPVVAGLPALSMPLPAVPLPLPAVPPLAPPLHTPPVLPATPTGLVLHGMPGVAETVQSQFPPGVYDGWGDLAAKFGVYSTPYGIAFGTSKGLGRVVTTREGLGEVSIPVG